MSLKDFFTILEDKTMRLTTESADSQIDSILLQYQNDTSVEDGIDEGYTMPDYFKVLMEAGEEGEEEEPEDMAVGDDTLASNEPKNPRLQKIEIDMFAQKVANLAENYMNLLNIKPVVITRAKNLLEQGYPADVVQEFLDVLDREFGLTLEGDKEEEVPSAPPGGNAGPIGA